MATEHVTRSRRHPNREHHTSKMCPAVGSRGAILTEPTLGCCRPTSGDSHLVFVFGIVRNSALLRLPAAIVVEPGGQKLLPIEGKIRSPLSFATSPLILRSRCAFPPPGSPVRRRISFWPVVGHSSATASSARRTFPKEVDRVSVCCCCRGHGGRGSDHVSVARRARPEGRIVDVSEIGRAHV